MPASQWTIIAALLLLFGHAMAVRHEFRDGPLFRTMVTSLDTKSGPITRANTTKETESDQQPYRPTYMSELTEEPRISVPVDVEVLDKPHNLFIGRCTHAEKELHREKIVLNNDGRSHVTAVIRLAVDRAGDVEIRCVSVLDEAPGAGAYPSYVGGGVGYNFVEVGVSTQYGKGFEMFVQIFGRVLRH